MGSSTSKAARKLPTSSSASSITSHPQTKPQWVSTPSAASGARVRVDPDESASFSASGSGSSSNVLGSGKGKERFMGSSQDTLSPRGMSSDGNNRSSRSGSSFSGEKDDAIRRDAMDPQFMSNLSKLGQVRIHDAGRFVPNPVSAQRTLNSRLDEFTNPNLLPPPNHLTAPLLSSLLDSLKTLSAGTDPSKVYAEYGMEKERMDGLRRWVNSPSVKGDDDVVVVEGMQIVEMKAVWVDSADAVPATPKQIS